MTVRDSARYWMEGARTEGSLEPFPQTQGPACPLQGGVLIVRLGRVRLNHCGVSPVFWLWTDRSGALGLGQELRRGWDLPACGHGMALSSVVPQQAQTSPTASDSATAY